MHKAWGRLIVIVSGVCTVVLLPIATNIATGTAVPEFFQQAWVSWTGVAVFGLVAVIAFVRTEWSSSSALPPPEAASDNAGGGGNTSSGDGAAENGDDGPEPEVPDEPIDTVPVPLENLPKVHGREDLLRQLIECRRTGGLVVLIGAGGMGKSTLARELARRTAVPDSPPAWLVSAATSDRFFNDLRALAANLRGSVSDLAVIGAGERAGPDCLWRLLWRAPDGWLLIIENADDPSPSRASCCRAVSCLLVLTRTNPTSAVKSSGRWPGIFSASWQLGSAGRRLHERACDQAGNVVSQWLRA